ncbi:Predicted Fe2+/Mn2+ transporter, VIT1/CCC1 family [Muriicola jejuensis]|uniref:VIT family protein n=1 Tax=Muriicola jejuensis TaxID=504488 RepID=A0A6P0UAS5_9FLAO|nr:VIT family protein [Muriicola jejuensis]NER09019.1 VIT family protein [Muriicola jejuensis]SMP12077.1 Predicted Fe2+/Mn2+ transporter, VIT1/CCC1 family [Muriicola jejuensis]
MEKPIKKEDHYLGRSNWLRASILGANDGILSTASIIVGVAAASPSREPIVIAGVAGLVAGALSMAAGEYVSVSSQTDIETSDLARERRELRDMPEEELSELASIYRARGLSADLALKVAQQLTEYDALGAHARDELGIHSMTRAKPMEAAMASGASFVLGGILPVIAALLIPVKGMILWQYVLAILFLIVLGAFAAKAGGSSVRKAILRITFWGTIAMGVTAYIGHLFGVSVA